MTIDRPERRVLDAKPSARVVRASALLSAGARERIGLALLFGIALSYVLLLLVAPLGALVWFGLQGGLETIVSTFSVADVQHALWLTVVITLATVAVTSVLGTTVALVLARDRFAGRRLVSAIVDLPLAVSPVIVGLMAVVLFGRGGWFDPFFAAHGVQVIFALPSMILVTIFISIPFVIREVVPVLHELGIEEEQAAWTLGASQLQTFFRVTLPNIRWGLLYGIALAAARSMGEVGAVLVVSGLLQGRTETATLYVLRAFDQYQEPQAYVVALTLAAFSIVLLVGIETFKRNTMREAG